MIIFSLMWCVWTEKICEVKKENKIMFKLAIVMKKLQSDGTFLNFVIKSTIGFISNLKLKKFSYHQNILYFFLDYINTFFN